MTRRGYVYESLLWLISYSCMRYLVYSLTDHWNWLHRRHRTLNWLLKSIILIEIIRSLWPNFSYKWIDSRIIGQWTFPYVRKPRVGRRLPSCRFICVSKKSRKYFSLFLSIHTPHLNAGWINLVSFSSKRFFNWTKQYEARKKTVVCECVAINFRFILLFWSLHYNLHRNLHWKILT